MRTITEAAILDALDALDARGVEVLRLVGEDPWRRSTDIATELGVSPTTVGRIRRSPEFQEALRLMAARPVLRALWGQGKAIEILIQAMGLDPATSGLSPLQTWKLKVHAAEILLRPVLVSAELSAALAEHLAAAKPRPAPAELRPVEEMTPDEQILELHRYGVERAN